MCFICAVNRVFIFPADRTHGGQLHSESQAYREPVYMQVVSLLCSHFIVQSIFA